MGSPERQPLFVPGDEVEVRAKNKNLKGGWYEAEVESLVRPGYYLVVYKPLADAADATKVAEPLRETVRASWMRHCPPPGRRNLSFTVDQPVEAFYRGGWWPGVVAEVHQVRLTSKRQVREYSVIVHRTKEKITCRANLMHRSLRMATESQCVGELVVEKRRKDSKPRESRRKKRRLSDMMASEPGESVHDHQNRTGPVTQGGTTMKSLDGHGLSNITVGILPCSTALEPSNLQDQRVEAKTNPEALITPKVEMTGDSVGDHQETVLVNEAPVEGHSNLRTQRGTSTELSDGYLTRLVANILGRPGTSNSQSQHHEAGTEHESLPATIANMDAEAGKEPAAVVSTPRSETAGGLIAPLSNELESEGIQWPFEKCSPVWQYIDTQVMPKIGQWPHFRPLEESSEVLREGIALNLLVTYEKLMNGKGCLNMDSSCRNLDENMKTVINLEENGFNVQHLRANLEELRRVKRDRERLLENKCETEAQAVEIKAKSVHLNAEFEETDKAVMALKLALKLFNERRTSLRKQIKETKTLNAKVQRDLKSAEEELVSLDGRMQELLAIVRVNRDLWREREGQQACESRREGKDQ